MHYINYLSLPKIPDNLKEDLAQLKARPFKADTIFDTHTHFKVKDVAPELVHWCQSIFDFEIDCRYQFVYRGLAIHADQKGMGRKVAFNYILDAGGENAKIMIYDHNRVEVESLCAELERWHFLRTNMLHTVINIELNHVRIGLSVSSVDHNDPKVEKFIEKSLVKSEGIEPSV